MKTSPRWKLVSAHVRRATEAEPLPGMRQENDRLHFGANQAMSLEGRPYVLNVEYTVTGAVYPISFTMVCDQVPHEIELAYNPLNPAEWDWPADRMVEGD